MLLITGANGQLGRALAAACCRHDIAHRAVSRSECNIRDPDAVKALCDSDSFECIFNCAAYTNVDAAEGEPAAAYAVNAFGPWLLARSGIPLVHISTDYVFDGLARSPYETHAPTSPLSVYGLSKRAGETALLEGGFNGLVIRTAWLYDKAPGSRNFYQTIRRLADERRTLQVVADQIGTPTHVVDLAEALVALYERQAHRQAMHLVHFTNSGHCSWYDFACAIVRENESACSVYPIPTSAYPTRAIRPQYSVLSLKSLDDYGIRPRHWLEAFRENFYDV